MNRYKKIIFFCALMGTTAAHAQQTAKDSTLNRTVVVENEYNPEVMDAYKVNILPQIEEPAVSKKQIQYAQESRKFHSWNFTPIQPFARTIEAEQPQRGFLRTGYGNRSNTDVLASYLWDITDRDRMDVVGSFYGHDGKIPMGITDNKWNSRFFRADASAAYSHRFEALTLKMGCNFASQVFNYMNNGMEKTATDHQHFTMGGGYIGVESHNPLSRFSYAAQAGFDAFSRKNSTPGIMDGREMKIHLQGYTTMKLDKGHMARIDFSMDNMIYNNNADNFTLFKIKPSYTFGDDDITLRAGINLDAQTSFGSRLKVSPDICFQYTFASSYVFFANISGGTTLNDYTRLNQSTPYWDYQSQPVTTYSPLDASTGLKASPVAGVHFSIYGGYRIVDDELFACPLDNDASLVYSNLYQWDAKVAYVGASAQYSLCDVFGFNLSGKYNHWDVDDEVQEYMVYKPKLEVNASVSAQPLNHLNLTLAYDYISRFKVYGVRAKAVSDLSLAAHYDIMKSLKVFVNARNLLNQKYMLEGAYPVQGISVLGGISVSF